MCLNNLQILDSDAKKAAPVHMLSRNCAVGLKMRQSSLAERLKSFKQVIAQRALFYTMKGLVFPEADLIAGTDAKDPKIPR